MCVGRLQVCSPHPNSFVWMSWCVRRCVAIDTRTIRSTHYNFNISLYIGTATWLLRCILRTISEACNTDTTPTQPHRNSNTHWTKNNTTIVVIQQNSHKLLMMDILLSEKCWAHKKWNKIASDVKLVFYSSTNITLSSQHNGMGVF